MVSFERSSPQSAVRAARSPDAARPDAISALADVVKATQRMMVARLDLLQIEARDALQGVALLAAAALIVAFGWALLMAGAVALLQAFLPTPASFAIVGAAHLLGGAVVAVRARRRARLSFPADDQRGHL